MSSSIPYKPPIEEQKTDFLTVLEDEIKLIKARREVRGRGDVQVEEEPGKKSPDDETAQPEKDAQSPSTDAYASAYQTDLVGLSFSGGGIRSGTFNLGVIQGLAMLGLLKKVDYLSTVSGGGYIGSWLTGLIHRAYKNGEKLLDVEYKLRPDRRDLGADADTGSGSSTPPVKMEEEPETPAIRFLRKYSNYLTPNVGFLSADTWSVIATYLRNLLLVLLTLVAGMSAVLMLPRLVHELCHYGILYAQQNEWLWSLVLAAVLAVSVVMVGLNMGGSCKEMVDVRHYSSPSFFKRFWVLVLVALPLFLASVGGSLWLRTFSLQNRLWQVVFGMAIVYSGCWFLAFLVAWGYARKIGGTLPRSINWGRLIGWGSVAGFTGGFLIWGIGRLLLPGGSPVNLWCTLTWGPPLILVGYVLTASLQIGLVGRHLNDYHREWLSRVGAWLLIFAAAWAVLFTSTVYGTPVVYWANDWLRMSLTAGWLGATLAGLLASRGSESRGNGSGLVRAAIGKAAPYIFIIGLLLWLGVGIDRVLDIPDSKSEDWRGFVQVCESARRRHIDDGSDHTINVLNLNIGGRVEGYELQETDKTLFQDLVKAHWDVLKVDSLFYLWFFGSFVIVFVLFGWRVDVNEFSMHRLYRNRLVRCYLGASVKENERELRHQPFTGFCLTDDIDLDRLGPAGANVSMGPYHLINTTLNLVAGSQLAWQERKAASFIFSPLYCGFGYSGFAKGYRRTPGFGSDPKKLTLGTAMAISGAAASPNMGFRSSPALSFLLTVFNVRLGWWLGNPGLDRECWFCYPRKPFWKFSGPRFATSELISELLGLTHEEKPYVYLSDGGHFENLGLYELVRRRCRLIIASDCGADPRLEFDDLGNAIRKCRVDLGVEIEIDPGQIRPEDSLSCWHWAVGKIHYSHEQKGTLLYLKSSISGDEPEDVLNYRAAHSEFPHQTTGDQWFDESQFESYRRLGEHVVLGALQEAQAESLTGEGVKRTVNTERLAQSLIERWHPPSKGVEDAFTRHSQKLDALYESLRTEGHLEFLSEQFYPEWRSLLEGKPSPEPPGWLPAGPDSRRHGFYFCNSLIQLMEDVYLDLDLEHQWDHPDNRGWMNLFRHWSWSGMFQVTWAICASTYGLRFQRFCCRRLGLDGIYRVTAKELTEARDKSSPIEVDEVAHWHELNFVERDIIRCILTEKSITVNTVYALLVEVKNPIEKRPDIKECMSYCCGFALAEITGKHRRIVCMRIQDHLRMMGLARKALRELSKTHRLVDEPEFCGVAEKHESMFPSASMTKFLQLYRSVRRELRAKGS